MEYLLGIDVGTSGTKCALFTIDGTVAASATFEYPMLQPRNGWAEQDPAQWWDAVVKGVRHLLSESKAAPDSIRGIGLSGQMHGLVLLDKDGELLDNAIIWCDQRTGQECDDMTRDLGVEKIIAITANPPMTGFTAAKLLWIKKNKPEIFKKTAHILLPKDYIRYKLSGDFATDVSDASGMQMMDIANRSWSSEMLEYLGLSEEQVPKMYESPDVTGSIHSEAAKLTGLAEGTIIVGGASDNAAAAIGTGVVSSGSAFTTIGSSGVVYGVSDTVAIDMKGRIHTFCASVPGKWTVMSCTQGAGLSLKWLRDTCCTNEIERAKLKNIDPYIFMNEMAAESGIGARGLIFLPYLMGERSPHPDPDCRGVFFGLSAFHDRGDMIRAVMEGVSYSQLECVDVFREMGLSIDSMTLCGGGAKSALWRQMLADLYKCDVESIHSDEGPALGAAILAGVGAEIYSSVEEGCKKIIRKEKLLKPDSARHEQYMPYYSLYKKLYITLFESFKELSQITQV